MDESVGSGLGPVALVGSGEFLDAMVEVDARLLAGRPPRVAVIPTAAAREGRARVAWWLELARNHYEAMGVESVPVPVFERADAEDPEMVKRLEGVGLVYFSGGDPHHLASTVAGSALWRAVADGWKTGVAVAGCSAGAMALTSGAPPDLGPSGARRRGEAGRNGDGRGLGLAGGLVVIPHFDLLERRRPGVVEWFAAWQPPGTTLVGVEEETALVGSTTGWRVEGRASVWKFGAASPERFEEGDEVPLPVLAPVPRR
jgi:cyanophycinase